MATEALPEDSPYRRGIEELIDWRSEYEGWRDARTLRPFNDSYLNYSRDGLPNHQKISDIIERILAVAEQAILANGGTKSTEGGTTLYKVNSDLP